jgi:hypothetical protein
MRFLSASLEGGPAAIDARTRKGAQGEIVDYMGWFDVICAEENTCMQLYMWRIRRFVPPFFSYQC